MPSKNNEVDRTAETADFADLSPDLIQKNAAFLDMVASDRRNGRIPYPKRHPEEDRTEKN